jgi:integrase
MASVVNDPNGRRRILFVAPDGSRKAIRLGVASKKDAEAVARRVEALLASGITGQPPARDVAVWLEGIGDGLREKLARVGLVEAQRNEALGEFLREFVLSRRDVKPATVAAWRNVVRNLVTFFGESKRLRSITAGDAEQFRQWLSTQKLAPTTVAKRLTFARSFLHAARKHRFIDENPFSEVKIPTADVSLRQRFIDRDTTQRLLDAATPTWRTIIALTRFGGLRCPSEVLSLQWCHVDWVNNRITVPSPKTEGYAGGASRVIPMFAELRPFLQEAAELAEPGQTHVVGGSHLAKSQGPNGWQNCNLRTTFEKLIRRCGLTPWPRLFHNLRSSFETELLDQHPLHCVAKWLGHNPQIAAKHYAQTTESHFDRAVQGGAQNGAASDGKTQNGVAGVPQEPRELPSRAPLCLS